MSSWWLVSRKGSSVTASPAAVHSQDHQLDMAGKQVAGDRRATVRATVRAETHARRIAQVREHAWPVHSMALTDELSLAMAEPA